MFVAVIWRPVTLGARVLSQASPMGLYVVDKGLEGQGVFSKYLRFLCQHVSQLAHMCLFFLSPMFCDFTN
jgi:hypothetical protein